jgi:hypothetical protein
MIAWLIRQEGLWGSPTTAAAIICVVLVGLSQAFFYWAPPRPPFWRPSWKDVDGCGRILASPSH